MLRTTSKLFVLSCIAFLCVHAQNEHVDELISQVFVPNAENNDPTPMPTGAHNPVSERSVKDKTEDECDCVPNYLCKSDNLGLIDIIVRGNPCANSFETCCDKEDRVEEPLTTLSSGINDHQACGIRNPDGVGFKINSGVDSETQFGEFPWMVAILSEESLRGSTRKFPVYRCGGSLIHPKAVLTAAHCVLGKNSGNKFKIRAGEWDSQTKNEIYPHQDRDIETIITHKDYRSDTLYNDIAILILKEPVDISKDNVGLVCLPPLRQVSNASECYTSGWGKDVFGKEGTFQVILKKVELPMVDHDKCQQLLQTTRLGEHFELHSSFICAGGISGRNTCKGDGGSPLVCPIPGHKGRYFQSGIVAWNIRCSEDIPGVYTNVAELRGWVDEQMASQKLELTYDY